MNLEVAKGSFYFTGAMEFNSLPTFIKSKKSLHPYQTHGDPSLLCRAPAGYPNKNSNNPPRTLFFPLCSPPYKDRLRVVPHFSSGIVERAKRERAWKSPHARKGDTRRGERKIFSLPAACRLFLIFTRARVSLALLSLRKNGGLLVV